VKGVGYTCQGNPKTKKKETTSNEVACREAGKRNKKQTKPFLEQNGSLIEETTKLIKDNWNEETNS
jgi:hypothetical protein